MRTMREILLYSSVMESVIRHVRILGSLFGLSALRIQMTLFEFTEAIVL